MVAVQYSTDQPSQGQYVVGVSNTVLTVQGQYVVGWPDLEAVQLSCFRQLWS